MVELICAVCGAGFSRPPGEVRRNARLGRPTYCSRSCAGKANFRNIPAGSSRWDHLPKGSKGDHLSPFRACYNVARNRARLNQREFTLTLNDMMEQWLRQGGRCPYTGWELILPKSTTEYNHFSRRPQNASLDRKDSSQGYVPENIQFVSLMANYAKSDFSHEEMLDFCWAIAQHLKRDE